MNDLIKKWLATNPILPESILKTLQVRAERWESTNADALTEKKKQLETQLETVTARIEAISVKPIIK